MIAWLAWKCQKRGLPICSCLLGPLRDQSEVRARCRCGKIRTRPELEPK